MLGRRMGSPCFSILGGGGISFVHHTHTRRQLLDAFAYFDACCDAGADGPPSLPFWTGASWLAGWLLTGRRLITMGPPSPAGPPRRCRLSIFLEFIAACGSFDVALCSVTNV
jgi:hypothetical protein